MHAFDISILTACFVTINIILTWTQFWKAHSILRGIKNNRKLYENNSTIYINEYTKIAFIMEYLAIANILDRFSTNSTIKLNGWYVPHSLEGIYVS